MRREPFLVSCAVAATAIFTILAVLVPRGVLAHLDTEIMLAARDLHRPALTRVVMMISNLGWAPIVIPLVCLFAAWCWGAGDRRAALATIAVALADVSANALLKQGFQRARPELWPRMPTESYAFPSGHAMTGVAIYGMLAVVIIRRAPAARPWLLAIAPLVCLSVGLSRIYLGVHWPSDVVAGWAAGLVLLIIGLLGLIRFKRR